MQRLHQLAISDEGFLFDPTTGESFTANQTGLHILKSVKSGKTTQQIALEMSEQFRAPLETVDRDVNDFLAQLRTHRLI